MTMIINFPLGQHITLKAFNVFNAMTQID